MAAGWSEPYVSTTAMRPPGILPAVRPWTAWAACGLPAATSSCEASSAAMVSLLLWAWGAGEISSGAQELVVVVGDERQLVTLRWTGCARLFLEDLFAPAAQGVEMRPASIFKNNENSRNQRELFVW